jgi:hypothetical protein
VLCRLWRRQTAGIARTRWLCSRGRLRDDGRLGIEGSPLLLLTEITRRRFLNSIANF